MKKTLIALSGAVVLLVIVLLLDRHRDASRVAGHFAFDTTQKADVDFLNIYLGRDTASLLKISGKWAASDSFPVDTGRINRGLSELLSLQSKEIVSTNPSRLSEFGLDTTQAKHVEWHMGDKVIRVVLGKTSGTDYGSTYWKWEVGAEVFSTPGNFTWDISPRIVDWKDRNLFKLEAKDLKQVQVDWRDSTDALFHYKLEVGNDSVTRMVEPESSSVIKSLVQPILAQCAQLSIDDFVASGDIHVGNVRLDTPMVAIRIELKNGKLYEIKAGRTFDTYAYIKHPFRKDIVKMSSWRLDPFKKKPGSISGKDTVQIVAEKKSKKH